MLLRTDFLTGSETKCQPLFLVWLSSVFSSSVLSAVSLLRHGSAKLVLLKLNEAPTASALRPRDARKRFCLRPRKRPYEHASRLRATYANVAKRFSALSSV